MAGETVAGLVTGRQSIPKVQSDLFSERDKEVEKSGKKHRRRFPAGGGM